MLFEYLSLLLGVVHMNEKRNELTEGFRSYSFLTCSAGPWYGQTHFVVLSSDREEIHSFIAFTKCQAKIIERKNMTK